MAPAAIDALLLPQEEAFPVLPENWEACRLYQAVGTAWRYGMMGELLGLDYPGVEVVIRRGGFADSPELFAQLQLMERITLDEHRKGRPRKH